MEDLIKFFFLCNVVIIESYNVFLFVINLRLFNMMWILNLIIGIFRLGYIRSGGFE